MAFVELSPLRGAIYVGSTSAPTFIADFASFDIEANTAIDNVTPYGTNVCSRNASSQTPDYTFNVGGFIGKSTTNAQPLLGGVTNNIFIGTNLLTIQADTSCTESCSAFLQRFRISQQRLRGFTPAALTFKNQGEITEAWVTT